MHITPGTYHIPQGGCSGTSYHGGHSSESAEQHSQQSLIAIISFPLGNNAFTDFNSLVGYVEETVQGALKEETVQGALKEETVQGALKEESSRTIYKMTSLHTPTALRT